MPRYSGACHIDKNPSGKHSSENIGGEGGSGECINLEFRPLRTRVDGAIFDCIDIP